MNSVQCPSCGGIVREGTKFCPSCGTSIQSLSTRESISQSFEKEAPSASKAMKHPMSSRAKLMYTLLAVILCGIFLFIFTQHLPGGANPVIANQPDVAMASMFTDVKLDAEPISVQIQNGVISFPLSILLEKKFVQFDYQAENTSVPVLAYISPEGKLVTSIRLCEPCNSKTFHIDGTELACGNCDTRWKLNNLEGIQGNCQKYPPAPIPSTVEGNNVHIDESIVKHWKIRI